MNLKRLAFAPLRKMRTLVRIVTRRRNVSPLDIVKTNTREAFEFFYSQDEFLSQQYLVPSRLALYQAVADDCAQLTGRASGDHCIRVVDVGCGAGHMLDALRRRLSPTTPLELVGLDFAGTAIAKARSLLPHAQFLIADIYNTGLPADHFDIVLCIETLEHLHQPGTALREMMRICKPAGKVVITVPDGAKDTWEGHINFWTAPQLRDLLSSCGPAEITVIERSGGHLQAILTKSTSCRP